jgi:hypothetical protein
MQAKMKEIKKQKIKANRNIYSSGTQKAEMEMKIKGK